MSSRNRFLGACLLVVCGAIALRGELAHWLQNIEANSVLEHALFRSMWMPGGEVVARRPPKGSQAELSKVIAASPAQSDLYSLRALEDEQVLDFTAAEADWKQYVERSADKAAAGMALADYYQRRLKPEEEIGALLAA